jgi:Sec-independent protein secretion pathway component TatC
MINATSQKRALKAIPKLVFGLIVFFGVAFAAPIVCGYACTTGQAYLCRLSSLWRCTHEDLTA